MTGDRRRPCLYQCWLAGLALSVFFWAAFLGYLLLYLDRLAGPAARSKKKRWGRATFSGSLAWAPGSAGTKLLLAVFLAYLLSAVVILPLLFWRRLRLGQQVPFGPALAAAGVIALLFGRQHTGPGTYEQARLAGLSFCWSFTLFFLSVRI